MNGVDILTSEEVVAEYAFNFMSFWIVVAIVGIGSLVYSIYQVCEYNYSWPIIPALTILFTFIGATVGVGLGMLTQTPIKYETQYKVVISDDVKMTDFLDKYEIIDTEGKIYTVREK